MTWQKKKTTDDGEQIYVCSNCGAYIWLKAGEGLPDHCKYCEEAKEE